MQKLNICLVSLAIPPDSQDGSAKFFKGVYNYLKRKGHNVVMLTGKWNYELSDPNIIQIKFIRKRFFWVPQFNLQVIKYLKSHQFDIVHGNGPKASLPIIFSNQKRFISTIHDMGPFETKFTKFPLEKYLIRQIVLKSTYITTCSKSIQKEIKKFIPKVKIDKIYSLFSAIEEKFKPYPTEGQKLKKKLNIVGPVLLYVGRIAHYKGVEEILSAYYIVKKIIPNLNLVMGGLPDYRMQEKYIQWKKIHKDVKFVGFIAENQIPYYYSMGDIFVTYSYAAEGFGLTPIEAIACGTPVICSSLPAYKEVLNGNALFVRPKSPKLLAKAIIGLLQDNELRTRLINRAQEFIKKYTWEAVGKKLEKVYTRFLS